MDRGVFEPFCFNFRWLRRKAIKVSALEQRVKAIRVKVTPI
jgi:hypothetical protein